MLEAFGRAQDAIIEVARSTARMIEKAGAAARPDRVDVEFGLKFSASGGVIMAGVAGEASLKVTLGYDVAAGSAAARRWLRRCIARTTSDRRLVAVTAAAKVPDARVPGYLGRVLDGDGAPVGTCFQVAPGVLVTAWHVLDDIGAAADDARVRVDPLAGGTAFDAAVARMDPVRDLAVLTCAAGLPAVAGPLAATDQMALRMEVTVTGHACPDDCRSRYRFSERDGGVGWGTTRDDAVPAGRMTSSAVVPGMSGGPVIRDSDGAVAGVVSGRYNSADGWLAGTVWVARTEDLAVLLDGIAEVTVRRAPVAARRIQRPVPGRGGGGMWRCRSPARSGTTSSRSPRRCRSGGCAVSTTPMSRSNCGASTWPRSCRPSTASRPPRWSCSSPPSTSIGTGPGSSGGPRWPGRYGSGGSTCCRPGSMTRRCPGCCRTWSRSTYAAGRPEQFAEMIAGKLAGLDITAPAPSAFPGRAGGPGAGGDR